MNKIWISTLLLTLTTAVSAAPILNVPILQAAKSIPKPR